jgi:ferredoxin--NADP+ reductase
MADTVLGLDDRRVIAAEAPEYNATLVKRVDYTHELASFWIRPDGPPVAFSAGQYVTVGAIADDILWQRPYSVASPPYVVGSEGYELYVRHVPVVHFTTLLWRLPLGARLWVSEPAGAFTLDPGDRRTHLYLATGTAIAPFLSMIWQTLMEGRPCPTVLLNGVSYASDLGYRAVLEGMERNGTYPLRYVPTVSRRDDRRNDGWRGRLGRVEDVLAGVCDELGLQAGHTTAYVCGNPDMIDNVDRILEGRGFPRHLVKRELYWPKGPGRPEWMRRGPSKDMTGAD